MNENDRRTTEVMVKRTKEAIEVLHFAHDANVKSIALFTNTGRADRLPEGAKGDLISLENSIRVLQKFLDMGKRELEADDE